MGRSKGSVRKDELEYRQVYIKVAGDSDPVMVTRPLKDNSYPANYVPIPGCVVEIHRGITENDAFKVAGEIARLCKGGQLLQTGGLHEHLAYAWSILCDLIKDTEGDFMFSKETVETLIRGAMDHIRKAGKDIGFDCEECRDGER